MSYPITHGLKLVYRDKHIEGIPEEALPQIKLPPKVSNRAAQGIGVCVLVPNVMTPVGYSKLAVVSLKLSLLAVG